MVLGQVQLEPTWLEYGLAGVLVIVIALGLLAFDRHQKREVTAHKLYAKRLEEIGASCHAHALEITQNFSASLAAVVAAHKSTLDQMDQRWQAESRAVISAVENLGSSVERLRGEVERRGQ